MQGLVFAIERCSLHDGPGIRTTVFLKGCPLHCLWCHNPESLARRPELYFLAERCLHCGACAAVCPHGCHEVSGTTHLIHRESCQVCGRCVEACPAQALEIKGRWMETAEVLAEVEKDRAYYQSSGGGLTLSGGEPLAQFEFARDLLRSARQRGLHTCLETSAQASTQHLLDLVPWTDLFLCDWKESDPDRHRQFTGSDNHLIRANLLALDQAGATLSLRCPVVPGLNARPDHFQGIADLANRLPRLRSIEIMPYHPLGQAKSQRLGRDYPLADLGFPDPAEPDRWRATLRALTAVPVA